MSPGVCISNPEIIMVGMIKGMIKIERKLVFARKYPWIEEVSIDKAALRVISNIPENISAAKLWISTLYNIVVIGSVIAKLINVHTQSAKYFVSIIRILLFVHSVSQPSF